ncbi:hypothetical protein BAC3_02419 [uncultured bacterium]|nr:hypothetical protein BAC3_02419 [uncultured bacterium]
MSDRANPRLLLFSAIHVNLFREALYLIFYFFKKTKLLQKQIISGSNLSFRAASLI